MINKVKKYLASRFYRRFVVVYLIFVLVVIIFSINIFRPFS